MTVTDHRAVAELVRLPSVLTVPGDSFLGAAAAGVPLTPGRTLARVAASGCLYLGGMALNDYADREVDAAERPHRPIPSGRIHPTIALRMAQGLTLAGVALAGAAGGWRALRVAVPLAGLVWAYDLRLKDTPAGPVAMAGCRALDVLLGATAPGGRLRPALGPAAVVAGHTLSITLVSRHEAQGGSPQIARRSLWGTAAVTATAAASTAVGLRRALAEPAPRDGARRPLLRVPGRGLWPGSRPGPGDPGAPSRRRLGGQAFGPGSAAGGRLAAAAVSAGLLAAYASAMARAGKQAVEDPSPARLQNVVGTGVLGFMPLEGALLAGHRRPLAGTLVAALWPVARTLARRRSVT